MKALIDKVALIVGRLFLTLFVFYFLAMFLSVIGAVLFPFLGVVFLVALVPMLVFGCWWLVDRALGRYRAIIEEEILEELYEERW